MKRLVLFLFVAVLMVGCATTYYDSEGNPVSKEKMSQLRATAVKAHLAEHRYRVFVDRMYLCVVLQSIYRMTGDSR